MAQKAGFARPMAIVAAFLLFASSSAFSQAPAWEPAGFGGAGNFLSVHFDPTQPGVVYALSDVAGVLRSGDYGDRWEIRGPGLGNTEISAFAIDPFDADTLYAGAGALPVSERAGMYVSHDAGATWGHLPATQSNGIAFRKYRTADTIAPSPSLQGLIVVGSRSNGVWRSQDGGATWAQVLAAPLTSAVPTMNDGNEPPPTPPYPAPVSVVRFDDSGPATVYAGFDGAGVYRNDAGGAAGFWEESSTGLPAEATVKDLAVSGTTLYAAAGRSGVYKSTDGGDSWSAVNGAIPLGGGEDDPWVSSVAVEHGNPGTAYLTLATYDHANVWKTENGGGSWTGLPNIVLDEMNNPTNTWAGGPTMCWRVRTDPHDSQNLYYADFWGIQRSPDGGATWVNRIVGAQNTCVTDVVAEPGDGASPGLLWATHMDAGILLSFDRGTTWEMSLPLTWDEETAGHFWNFEAVGDGPTTTYYATSDPWSRAFGQVVRSLDGENWSSVFQNPRPAGEWMGGAMMGLAVDPSHSAIVYVTQDGGQVWKSSSSGDPGSWAPCAAQPDDRSFTYALDVDEAGRVFVGTLNGGLFRSADGGGSWEQVSPGITTFFRILAVPGALYAAAGDDRNLYRSTDGGDNWDRLTDLPATSDADDGGDMGMAIAVDPEDPDHVFYSNMQTWHPLDSGMGIYESTDGGETWSEANDGLPVLNVSCMDMGSDGTLYAGTWCANLWRRPAEERPTVDADPIPLDEIRYWGYQIQSVGFSGSVEALVDSQYDMLVLEPTRTDWTSGDQFFDVKTMVERLKASPASDGVHRKLVIAYIDIGEAEDWRWYFTYTPATWDCQNPPTPPPTWPDWILACDPDGWGGNYVVKYWDPAWKDLVIYGQNQDSLPYGDYTSIVDEVIKAGFDGVYLDWVEGFENTDVINAAAAEGKDAAVEMINFIQEIRDYGRNRNPDFLVIQQNAAALMDGHPELFGVIDAIAQEEVWYGGIATDDWEDPQGYDDLIDPTLTAEYIGWLDQYLAAGVPVFNCEYALTLAPQAYADSAAKGYVCYATRRSLSKLTTTPPSFDCAVSCSASAVPSNGQAPLEVAFTASATASNCLGEVAYGWDFGDGGSSAQQNPTHTCTTPGIYTWTMTATADGASCTQTGTITVTSACYLTCSATADPTSGPEPLMVTFSAAVTADGCGLPTYSWDFGDGGTSTEQNPTYTYIAEGAYPWTFTVTADGVTCTKTGTVTVTSGCAVVCSAMAEPTSGEPPLTVDFSSTATANGCASSAAFHWDFGDGATDDDQYPSHTYGANGTYTWTMTASADEAECVETGTVVVSDGSVLPGDCDGNGSISIGEVQRAINMFLGSETPGCGVDCDGNGSISVGEVQRVINGFLGEAVSC